MLSAKDLAAAICTGFKLHDDGKLDAAAKEFTKVYAGMFPNKDAKSHQVAGECYAEALRIKDEIDCNQDREARLVDPRWARCYDAFLRLAKALDLSPRWAFFYNEFWRMHKAELDYWTPLIESERILVAHACGDVTWVEKKSDGRNGPGPLPYLYAVGVEAHDLHTEEAWEMAYVAMTQYFSAILSAQAKASMGTAKLRLVGSFGETASAN